MAAKRTLLAALFVDEDDDINELVAYWGAGGREERVKPILELASRVRSPWGVPVELLLPPIPRSVLYTYQKDKSLPFELDCNWSAYNSMLQPWLLMKRDDMEAYFASEFQTIRPAYFRIRSTHEDTRMQYSR